MGAKKSNDTIEAIVHQRMLKELEKMRAETPIPLFTLSAVRRLIDAATLTGDDFIVVCSATPEELARGILNITVEPSAADALSESWSEVSGPASFENKIVK